MTEASLGAKAQIHCKRGNQGQAEISVRDRRLERTFSFCAFDVYVDPLSVAGAFGELVYSGLVDLDPIRSSEILTDKVLYVIKRHLSPWHVVPVLTDERLAPRRFRERLPRHLKSAGNASVQTKTTPFHGARRNMWP